MRATAGERHAPRGVRDGDVMVWVFVTNCEENQGQ
jgi:hypothetical protein